jgi:hypothetical protein
MPAPGSKRLDIRRAHRRREAEDHGIPDQHADQDAKEILESDPKWQTRGPRTERGRGPKGEGSERRD